VHQILQNLLDNAEKYTRGSPDRTFRVSLGASDDGVALAVTDRGPGVDPALRRRLFRPFTRTRDPAAPAGLGIGLALVQALAHAQNANVTYTRVQQGGSSFTLVLPFGVTDLQPDEST
jgi:two-component system sensor histidine kinase KdpD